MILPVRRSGTRPPFFLVHGLYGVLWHTAEMGQALGPDQPFFPIFARGVDGREPACEPVAEMVSTYLQGIRDVAPTGPYFVGGQCPGGLLAIDIARTLADEGAPVAGVCSSTRQRCLLAVSAIGQASAAARLAAALRQCAQFAAAENRMGEPAVRFPRPAADDIAATVAVLTAVALSGYQPQPFAGPVELIVSAKRAPAYFQPDLPWQRTVPAAGGACPARRSFGDGARGVCRATLPLPGGARQRGCAESGAAGPLAHEETDRPRNAAIIRRALLRHAELQLDAIAIIDDERTITFGELRPSSCARRAILSR